MASRLTKPGLDNNIVSTDATLDAGSQLGVRQEVVVTSSSGAALPLKVDDAAFAVGTDTVTPIGAMLDNTSPDEVDEGDVGVLRMTQRGLHVVPYNTAGTAALFPAPAAMASSVANPTLTQISAFLMVWNGSTWDRLTSSGGGGIRVQQVDSGGTAIPLLTLNAAATVLASAARTIATNSADITNVNYRGAHIWVNVTAYTAGSITVTIQGKDEVSGTYYTLLVSPAIVATGLTVLKVYPGITAAANASASDIMPRLWRASVAVGSADSVTYSVGVGYVL